MVRYRSALISLIFRKALRLDMSCSSYSVGELTNLCSVDANWCGKAGERGRGCSQVASWGFRTTWI